MCSTEPLCESGGSASQVAILLGNGDGTFQPAQTYSSGGSGASSIAVADLNGDGKLDIVVANDDSNTFTVLLGNGDGTFQPANSFASGGYYPVSVAVADVNGDGKPDLLLANSCADSTCQSNGIVSVLLGDGKGGFTAPQSYSSGGSEAGPIAIADFNGDGKLDVAVDNPCVYGRCEGQVNGVLGVLLGNGDGTFQAALRTSVPPNMSGIGWQLTVADFNGDGKLDVVSGLPGVLLLGNGDGTFQAPLNLGAWGPGSVVGDFNGDGKPDLAVGGGNVVVLLNKTPTATKTTLASSQNPSQYDQPVTFTATIIPQYGGSATGTVTFYSGKTRIGSGQVSNNTVKLTVRSLSVGNYSVTAAYSGDSNFTGSTSSPLSQVVDRAVTTTMLTSSKNPSQYGQKVTFTATVTGQHGGTPTGTVTFKNGAIVLGKVMLSGGMAKYSTSTLAKGKHVISRIMEGTRTLR